MIILLMTNSLSPLAPNKQCTTIQYLRLRHMANAIEALGFSIVAAILSSCICTVIASWDWAGKEFSVFVSISVIFSAEQGYDV